MKATLQRFVSRMLPFLSLLGVVLAWSVLVYVWQYDLERMRLFADAMFANGARDYPEVDTEIVFWCGILPCTFFFAVQSLGETMLKLFNARCPQARISWRTIANCASINIFMLIAGEKSYVFRFDCGYYLLEGFSVCVLIANVLIVAKMCTGKTAKPGMWALILLTLFVISMYYDAETLFLVEHTPVWIAWKLSLGILVAPLVAIVTMLAVFREKRGRGVPETTTEMGELQSSGGRI